MTLAFHFSRQRDFVFGKRLISLTKRVGPCGEVVRKIAGSRKLSEPVPSVIISQPSSIKAPLSQRIGGKATAPMCQVVEADGYRLLAMEYGSAMITRDLEAGQIAILPATFQLPTKIMRSRDGVAAILWIRPNEQGQITVSLKSSASAKPAVALAGNDHPALPQFDAEYRNDVESALRAELLSAAHAIEDALIRNALAEIPDCPAVLCRQSLTDGADQDRARSILWSICDILVSEGVVSDDIAIRLEMDELTQDGSPQRAVLRFESVAWQWDCLASDVLFSRFLQPLAASLSGLENAFTIDLVQRGSAASRRSSLVVSIGDKPSAHERLAVYSEYPALKDVILGLAQGSLTTIR